MSSTGPGESTSPQSAPDADPVTQQNGDEATVADMVCDTCREPLVRYENLHDHTVEWRHPLNAAKDHDPLPIPRSAADFVVMYCDFCSSPDVAWCYQTRDEIRSTVAQRNFTADIEQKRISRDWMTVRHKEAPATDRVISNFSTGWTACGPCAELIELRDIERLITRARRISESLQQSTRTLLHQIYDPFFSVIGPRERVTTPVRPPQPPAPAGTEPSALPPE